MTHNPSKTGSRRPSRNKAPVDTEKKNHPDCYYVAFRSFPIGNHRSVKRGQPEELRLEVLQAPEPQRGLQGEAPVEVVVWYHHHLHAGGQPCLHAVGSVFKHQALVEEERENKVMLSSKPVDQSTGFHPREKVRELGQNTTRRKTGL